MLGKVLANFLFLLLAEILLLPVFAVLYNVHVTPVLGRLLLVLGTLGLTTTGTVLSAVASQARTAAAAAVAAGPDAGADRERRGHRGPAGDPPELRQVWLVFLVAFDVLFLTATWLFGEYLLEE